MLFCVLNHVAPDAVLYASSRTVEFQFCGNRGFEAVNLFVVGKLDNRGIANQVKNTFCNHKKSSISITY